ncbi:integral membrane protein [Halenospora varia]|nr:integral membrane protein [Halenospora varia]
MGTSTTETALELPSLMSTPIELHQKPPINANNDGDGKEIDDTKMALDQVVQESRDSTVTNKSAESISKWRASVIIGTVSLTSFINTMLAGVLVLSLPTIALELGLSQSLLLWPASVNTLASGCTFLLAGSTADIVGGRKIYLIGEFLLVITTIACGVSRTGIQLILFRASQGVAISLCLPSSVLLITKNIPNGVYRNTAFACLGAGQPLGFSVRLVLGGVFIDGVGWRYGYYIGAILTFVIFIISIFGIPLDDDSQTMSIIFRRMGAEIDWIGCALISTSLGMFSYVFSVLAASSSHFLAPASLSLFSIAMALLSIFAFYINRQERLGRKAIFPASIWRKRVFTSLCIIVFLMWGVFESMQFFLTLYFQSIQGLTALQTSVRFLPMVIAGVATNILTGWLVKILRADVLVLGSAVITSVSPLLMAIINPEWSFWTCAFFASACAPICADVLFTVANLLITTIFPRNAWLGWGGKGNGNSPPQTLMDGYKATFWLCFGVDIFILGIVSFGLRRIGKVGFKIE